MRFRENTNVPVPLILAKFEIFSGDVLPKIHILYDDIFEVKPDV
jgi:hypothetical protein